MRKLLRIVAIALWTFAAMWGWVLGLTAAMRLYVYLQQRYRLPLLPEWSAPLIFVGLFGVGTIIFTVTILLLAMRGRLPGTKRRKDRAQQGFPVKPVSASE